MKFLFCLALIGLGYGTARAEDAEQGEQSETVPLFFGAGSAHATVHNFGLNGAGPPVTRAGGPDISATTWKALAGFRALSWLAFEADYTGTASTSFTPPLCLGNCTVRSEASALSGYAVGLMPAGQHIDLFLKVGVDGYKLTVIDQNGSHKDTGLRGAAGVGVQAHAGHFGLRLEYERLPAGLTNGLQYVSLSVIVSTG